MAKITVLGSTGYAGSRIVATAKRRGHAVTAYSRNTAADAVPGVSYVQGSVLDKGVLRQMFDDVFIAEVENHSPVRQRFTVGY